MKFIQLLTFLGLFAASAAFAGQSDKLEEFYVYPFVASHTWKEFDSGAQLLRESGPLFGVGAATKIAIYRKSLLMKTKVELFGGLIDYNGQTTDVNPALSGLPVKTDVTYFGLKLENDIGWRFRLGKASVEPFAGIGYRWWLRDLHDSSTVASSGNAVKVRGTTEEWQTLYARLGTHADCEIGKDLWIFAEGGAKYPFLNRNTADIASDGTVTVRPGQEWSAFAEIGIRYKWLRPSFFYEGFGFSQSSTVLTTFNGQPVGMFQPKTKADMLGVNLGILFR